MLEWDIVLSPKGLMFYVFDISINLSLLKLHRNPLSIFITSKEFALTLVDLLGPYKILDVNDVHYFF